jgi:DNA phosphorothioation-associated putative methyltransferase
MQIAMREGLIHSHSSILDYGCGRGDDLHHLQQLHYNTWGFDPKFRPSPLMSADIVSLIYVLNVVELVEERPLILQDTYQLATQGVLVGVRPPTKHQRGEIFTSHNTYQKFFTPDEIELLISGVCSAFIKLAAGVYYLPKVTQSNAEPNSRYAHLQGVGEGDHPSAQMQFFELAA